MGKSEETFRGLLRQSDPLWKLYMTDPMAHAQLDWLCSAVLDVADDAIPPEMAEHLARELFRRLEEATARHDELIEQLRHSLVFPSVYFRVWRRR